MIYIYIYIEVVVSCIYTCLLQPSLFLSLSLTLYYYHPVNLLCENSYLSSRSISLFLFYNLNNEIQSGLPGFSLSYVIE